MLFVTLMLCATIVALLPPAWTGWMKGAAQPLSWIQHAGSSAARGVRGWFREAATPDVSTELLDAQERVATLERETLHLAATVAQLEQQVAELTGLHDQLRGAAVKLVLARLVAADPSGQRDAVQISVGSMNSPTPLAEGDWVAAAGHDAASASGDALRTQGVIGRVEHVLPLVSYVRLTTDRGFGPVRVRAARRGAEGWDLSEREALLSGRGGGRMHIASASEDYLASGYTHVVAYIGGIPPVWLVIGELEKSEGVPNAPLHFNVTVRPWTDPLELERAYVVSLP